LVESMPTVEVQSRWPGPRTRNRLSLIRFHGKWYVQEGAMITVGMRFVPSEA
jgi:hypothetical protein